MEEIKIYQKDNKREEGVLRTVSKDIDFEDINSKEINDLIDKMFDFLEVQPDGVALAAPQVGINKRIFIVSPRVFELVGRKIEDKDDLVFINPQILKKSKSGKYLEEGCFSVRWWYGKVKRSDKIKISAYNRKGVKKIWSASAFLSQVFQHEIDHLDGILFVDKAIDLEKISKKDKERIEKEKERLIEKKKK